MDFVKTLEGLEKVFVEAGKLAYKMQNGVSSHNKYNTGNHASDIVTDADLAVQEFLLQAITKTDLVHCRLLAEEDTPLTDKFNKESTYYLSIDPIDDTAIYARGGKHFSTIITLHDGKNILYMFVYFPAWNWTHKIVRGVYSREGVAPDLSMLPDLRKTIIYWAGDPAKNIPKEIYAKLISEGIVFEQIKDIPGDIGSIAIFACGKVAGLYYEDLNTYDGLVEYKIAKSRGFATWIWAPNGANFDLTNIKKRESGLYYPGYYLALTK